MYEYKEILGIITIIIAVVSYSAYFFNIFTTCTLPRTTSWFIWGLLNTIAFFVQYESGAGYGAWVTGFTAVMCLAISAISFFKCDEHLTKYDWIPLLGAFIAIILWYITDDALIAIIITTVTYTLGFIPTLHNAYFHPEEETATTFGLNSLKFLISLFAIESLSLTTWLYPFTLVILNAILASVIVLRRK